MNRLKWQAEYPLQVPAVLHSQLLQAVLLCTALLAIEGDEAVYDPLDEGPAADALQRLVPSQAPAHTASHDDAAYLSWVAHVAGFPSPTEQPQPWSITDTPTAGSL